MNNKMVTYKGSTSDSHANYSGNPDTLIIGQQYEVISFKKVNDLECIYTLKGITGEFAASWFSEKPHEIFPDIYFATASHIPVVDQTYIYWMRKLDGCSWKIVGKLMNMDEDDAYRNRPQTINSPWSTEGFYVTVKKVTQIGLNTYYIETRGKDTAFILSFPS